MTLANVINKMIVNGDISQIDLPRNVKSGLIDAQEKLKNIHQIDFVHFSAKDVVRHPVVAQIIRAYEPRPVKAEENHEETEERKRAVEKLLLIFLNFLLNKFTDRCEVTF